MQVYKPKDMSGKGTSSSRLHCECRGVCCVASENWSSSPGVLAVSTDTAGKQLQRFVSSQCLEDMKEVKVQSRIGKAEA